MALPSKTQISDAVESPSSYAVTQLKGYAPEAGIMGPNHFSGGFCIVFPISNGDNKKALRVWHTEISNIKERYKLVGLDMAKSRLPFLLNVEYVENGLLVDSKPIDVVLMDWVEGISLKEYINAVITSSEKSVTDKKVSLNNLSNHLLDIFRQMHFEHFAHGDLQHENIIVQSDGDVKLIDYDNFYSKSLNEHFSQTTTGYSGYQHPIRANIRTMMSSDKDDYFAELIIYLSIRAIVQDFSLWNISKDDDYALLFTKDDFADIQHSKLFLRVKQFGGEISMLCTILEEYLKSTDLSTLEPFDVILDRMTKLPEIHCFKCFPEVCLKDDNVILKWSVENYTQILLNGEDVTSADSIEITDVTEPDYTLTAHNYHKRVSSSFKLDILPRPVITFKADTQKLHAGKGESVTLSWNVKNAEKSSLIGPEGTKDNIKNNGTLELTPNKTTSYTLRVLALDKRTTVDTPLTIEVFPDAIVEYKTDKEYVFPSIPFTLSWEVQHAKLVELDGVAVKDSDSITYIDGVDKETIYTLRVTDEFGIKEYHKRIKMLPIPQVKAILVPTPDINEKINVSVNVPDFKCISTPIFRVNRYRLQDVHVPNLKNGVSGQISLKRIINSIKRKLSV